MNRRAVLALIALDVVLFLLSGTPAIKNSGPGAAQVLSDIVWFGFLIGFLVLVVTGALALAARVRRVRAHD
jgi:cytochrome b561